MGLVLKKEFGHVLSFLIYILLISFYFNCSPLPFLIAIKNSCNYSAKVICKCSFHSFFAFLIFNYIQSLSELKSYGFFLQYHSSNETPLILHRMPISSLKLLSLILSYAAALFFFDRWVIADEICATDGIKASLISYFLFYSDYSYSYINS